MKLALCFTILCILQWNAEFMLTEASPTVSYMAYFEAVRCVCVSRRHFLQVTVLMAPCSQLHIVLHEPDNSTELQLETSRA